MEHQNVTHNVEKYDPESNVVIENVVNETTKITDLNPDCMASIFEKLNFYDFLNVADCSKQFYGAVCQVFRNNYANQILEFGRDSRMLRIR